MSARITVELDNETMLKLARRSARVGMTPKDAVREIATKGVPYFLRRLVAPTKSAAARTRKGVRG